MCRSKRHLCRWRVLECFIGTFRENGECDISLASDARPHPNTEYFPSDVMSIKDKAYRSNPTRSSATSGGRPSQNQYHLNPHIDLILPHPTSIQCRFYHPPSGVSDLGPYTAPLNLTLFQRKQGGETGDQIATSGPYSDTLSGVRIGRIKIEEGVHVLVPSLYERGEGRGRRWRVDVWGDRAFEMEVSSRSG